MERRLHLFWPLTLIGSGVIWILIEMGRLPAANLWALTYLWPVLLIGAGVGLILRSYWRYAPAVMSVLMVATLFLGVIFAAQLAWNRPPGYAFDGSFMFGSGAQRGSGHTVTENRSVHGFTTLRVNYPANITIRQGATEALSLKGEDNVLPSIRTQVTSGTLEIDNVLDHRVYITPTRPVNIAITVKDLKEINFDSAGTVRVQGLRTDSVTALLDGAGSLSFNDLIVKTFAANLSGAGSVQASGSADALNVRVDGLGSLNAQGLHAQRATIVLDGMGSANVWVDSGLTANINGVGSVNYYGSPQVTKIVNGLGNIRSMGAK